MVAALLKRRVARPLSVPVWRRRGWRLWRDTYLHETPEFWRRAWVHHLIRDRHWLATVRDLTLGGVEMICDEPLTAGECFQLEVWQTTNCSACRVVVRVLSATLLANGKWLVNGAFARHPALQGSR